MYDKIEMKFLTGSILVHKLKHCSKQSTKNKNKIYGIKISIKV